MSYDVIVIGAGPTGASAALFTSKAGKSTLVIDSDQSVTKRAWIENHYGVDGITGPDLVEIGKKQAAKFGTEFKQGKAVKLESSAEGLQVSTEDATYTAKHVILATGLSVDLAEASGIEIKPGTEPRIKSIVGVDSQGKTNVQGVWAAGTVAGVSMHTIITAGDGAKVAINVISELNGARYVDHDVLKA
ncbi:NAD(P)/FAD-dependent oxidoreductase [Paenibacillus oryzisoli]|uniref:NAD(P)/FAD-dependent oxidoreductase n=1 Tax=Paenibacillus oryzisoli TaxID=1850517 RepID=UPI003D2D54EB